MRLYQAVGVEQDVFIAGEDHFLFFIAHARHQAEGHTGRAQFARRTRMLAVREIVSRVGVAEPAADRIEDGVEAGDEHLFWNIGVE